MHENRIAASLVEYDDSYLVCGQYRELMHKKEVARVRRAYYLALGVATVALTAAFVFTRWAEGWL